MPRVLCLFLFVAGAAAAPAATLRVYFSTTGPVAGVLAAPPPEALTHIIPVVIPGNTAHLYAEVTDAGTWNGLSLDYGGADGVVTLVNSEFLGLRRWNSNSDFAGRLNGTDPTNLVAVNELGLPNPYGLGALDNLEAAGGSVPGAETFYLGAASVTMVGNGAVFLHVGQGGISRVGGNAATDDIFFGWNDGAIRGNQFGVASTIADLITDIPEPTSAPLCILGFLALLRKR